MTKSIIASFAVMAAIGFCAPAFATAPDGGAIAVSSSSSTATGGNGGNAGAAANATGGTNNQTVNYPGGSPLWSGTAVSAPANVSIGNECVDANSFSLGVGVGVFGVSGGKSNSTPTTNCKLRQSVEVLKQLKAMYGGNAVLVEGGYTIDQLMLNLGAQMYGINTGKAPAAQVPAAPMMTPASAPMQSYASASACLNDSNRGFAPSGCSRFGN